MFLFYIILAFILYKSAANVAKIIHLTLFFFKSLSIFEKKTTNSCGKQKILTICVAYFGKNGI